MKASLVRSFACVFALSTSWTLSAAAQPSDGEQAIELGKRGLGEYEAQSWSACAQTFEAAEKLSHSPVLRLYQARCLRGDKQLLRARELLASVVAEPIAEDAPGPFRQAKIDAQAELGLLDRAIPTAVVSIVGADPASVKVFIDQQGVKPGVAVPLDPGSHEGSAIRSAPTGATARQLKFELAEGQKDVAVSLSFEEVGPRRTGPNAPPLPPTPADPGGSSGGLVPGAALLGVGGASAIAGAIVGGLALASYDSLNEAGCEEVLPDGTVLCSTTDAPPVPGSQDQADELATANVMADASTGLLVSGGIVAAVGLVIILALPGDDTPVVTQAGRIGIRF